MRESQLRSRPWPTVYVKHQRILLTTYKVRRISHHPIVLELIRPLPTYCFVPSQFQPCNFLVQFRQAHRLRRRILQIIQLRRPIRFAAGKSDPALGIHRSIQPKPGRRHNTFRVNLSRRASQWLHPQSNTRPIIRAHQQRFRIRHPDRPHHIAVDPPGHALPLPALDQSHLNLIHILAVPVLRIPVRNLIAIGRNQRLRLILGSSRERAHLSARNIEHLHTRPREIARIRRRHLHDRHALPVRRP